MAKRVALYLRVSTGEQTTENQRLELEAVAARSGWEIVAVFEDAGISGAKGRDKRPGFDKLLKGATSRKFDMIAAWSVDRLGRSLQDLIGFMNELRALGRRPLPSQAGPRHVDAFRPGHVRYAERLR
jgi:DNA invertase Pin-like site-specific DNA recombinase